MTWLTFMLLICGAMVIAAIAAIWPTEKKCPICDVPVGKQGGWCSSCNEFGYTNQFMTDAEIKKHIRDCGEHGVSPYAGVYLPPSCPAPHCLSMTRSGKPCKSPVHKDGHCFMHYWDQKK